MNSRSLNTAWEMASTINRGPHTPLSGAHGTVTALGRIIKEALGLVDDARTQERERASALVITIDRARDLTRDLKHALDKLRMGILVQIRESARADARSLTRLLACALDETPGGPYGLEEIHSELGLVLSSSLDDFTDANLTQADLSRTDLTGLYWTLNGTQWPPSLDTQHLLARSDEVFHTSGVYVVTRPPVPDTREAVPA
jgi:hypothetical protein